MLHYHGAPVSGPKDCAQRFYRGRHVMVSFAYPDHLPMVADVSSTFVMDNGAFTTWKSGKAFNFDAYVRWVEEWHKHPAFQWCVIPDVIDGNEEQNDAMLERWRNTGLRCGVPVWHFHERPERLWFLSGCYTTVALGSSGHWSTPGTDSWWDRLAEVWPGIVDQQGRLNVRLHGLRMLSRKVFTRIPFSSADSTNAAVNAGSKKRFGQYMPHEAWQRANVIADRIESYQSSPVLRPPKKKLQTTLALFE